MDWLSWTQQMQAIAQAGLTYSQGPYDRQRYEQLQALAAEILSHHTAAPLAETLAIVRAEAGYATPKVDVRAAVFRNGRILLVRETSDRRWSLPGGWADVGDSPSEVAAREVQEESGYEVRVTKILAVLDKARHAHPPDLWYAYKLIFLAEVVGGAPRASHETSEVGWFDRDALPELSVPRITTGQIARVFVHHDHPELPTDFD
jgi:ADP-ribose pyrophosphatase YjhB (NUDIX family)